MMPVPGLVCLCNVSTLASDGWFILGLIRLFLAMTCLLVTTDHLENRLLFRDFQDFVTGMNYVAILAFKSGIDVLAFVLMSNHLHFVLMCLENDAKTFVDDFKTMFSRYLWMKYGSKEHLRRVGVHIEPIEGKEALEWAIAYVQMNPVAANICLNPFEYRWGTGNVFFQNLIEDGVSAAGKSEEKGRMVSAVSERERFRLLHSRAEVPGDWLIGEAGFILPSSFVRKDIVEDVFWSPRRMNYFLQNSSKAKQRLAVVDANMPAFRDQVIQPAVPDLCYSLFQKRSVKELTEVQKVELLRQLRYRFSAGANQLARVTGLQYEEAAKFLDRV